MNARRSFSFSAVLLASITALACSATIEDDVDDSEAAQTSDGGADASRGQPYAQTLALPAPGATNAPLAVPQVTAAMKQVRREFYETTEGYGPSVTTAPPMREPAQCIEGACPDFWSDVACHYYCWMPSYSRVDPNIRACFTYTTSGSVKHATGRRLYYPEAYDYCVYQNATLDPHGQPVLPPHDEAKIAANKTQGDKPGPLAWVDENQKDVFAHVMFTWYEPRTYDLEHQQDALNAFYGVELRKKDYTVLDTQDVAECRAKRPVRREDPRNGTHCSSAKQTAVSRHSQADEFIRWMKGFLGVASGAGPDGGT